MACWFYWLYHGLNCDKRQMYNFYYQRKHQIQKKERLNLDEDTFKCIFFPYALTKQSPSFRIFFNQKKTRMDQTLAVWETQTAREAVHLKKKNSILLIAWFLWLFTLLFIGSDERGCVGFICVCWSLQRLEVEEISNIIPADHCNRSTH